MSTYVISDLHLSTLDSTNKSMEVFGNRWTNYTERLMTNWKRLVTDTDTVIIPGDVSWALSLDEALSDIKFIDSSPGIITVSVSVTRRFQLVIRRSV